MIEVEERWALITGFPDYAVSNYGVVKSLRYDRILKPRGNSYGHQRVVLYKDKEPYDFYVHRLVAAAFIEGFAPGVQVIHSNEDITDNYVYNLRFRKGKRMGQLRRDMPPIVTRRVRIIETGEEFSSVSECAKHINGHVGSIYRVIRGEREHHLGYTFDYIDVEE